MTPAATLAIVAIAGVLRDASKHLAVVLTRLGSQIKTVRVGPDPDSAHIQLQQTSYVIGDRSEGERETIHWLSAASGEA